MDAAPTGPPATSRSSRSKAPADLDRLKAQHSKGKTTRELGQEYGVAHTTIQRWLDQHAQQQRGVQQYKANRADILARVQSKSIMLQEELIEDLLRDRLSGALKAHQKTGLLIALNTIHGTLYDKERLETGQSTQNHSIVAKMLSSAVSDIYKPLTNKESVVPAPQQGAGSSEAGQVAPQTAVDSEAGQGGVRGEIADVSMPSAPTQLVW